MAKLVIVESPAKAKTIGKYLGDDYEVTASMGHIRDLPASQLGIDVEHGYAPQYISIKGKEKLIKELKSKAKHADGVLLATDPDREGEAISWHLSHVLNLPEQTTKRITFNEITKDAVRKSLKQARGIDQNLVDAQQARRVLDRIVGYKMSPVLWKKVRKGLSAGRVQSAALKLLCDRENEIQDFVQEEFWTIEGKFNKKKAKGTLLARLSKVGQEKPEIHKEEEARELIERIRAAGSFFVKDIKKGKRNRRPPLPFTTSTLQQEASKRLGFSPQKTMQIAQQLYEGVDVGGGTVGLITYLRTDSTRIAEEAHEAAVKMIAQQYGQEYVGQVKAAPAGQRIQDAHEAIRPTYMQYTPVKVQESLSRDQMRLYKLIYERFVASRMAAAVYDTLQIILEKDGFEFTSTGSKLVFAGFLQVYKEQEEEQEKFETIEGLETGDEVQLKSVEPQQHFTQPPPQHLRAHYSDADRQNLSGQREKGALCHRTGDDREPDDQPVFLGDRGYSLYGRYGGKTG